MGQKVYSVEAQKYGICCHLNVKKLNLYWSLKPKLRLESKQLSLPNLQKLQLHFWICLSFSIIVVIPRPGNAEEKLMQRKPRNINVTCRGVTILYSFLVFVLFVDLNQQLCIMYICHINATVKYYDLAVNMNKINNINSIMQ